MDIYDLVQARDSIVRTVRDSAQQRAALAALTAPRNGEPMFAQRVFLGRQPDKAAVLTLTDPAGRARIRMRSRSAVVFRSGGGVPALLLRSKGLPAFNAWKLGKNAEFRPSNKSHS